MRWFVLFLLLLFLAAAAGAQQEYILTIPTTLADTTETFWLQIPAGYQPERPCPLLIGWHQLGGNHLEMKNSTVFDSIANARGWIAASHSGPTATHWNNGAAQSHVVDVIRWIEERYAVDRDRIYMVGASMGGAGGMVFANNHLDPGGPRVAAAASLSGIQDCERRFHEQGSNNSMVGAFGGTPEEVPYIYHRNSAICFADSSQSMHFNARHLPLYLTFGSGVSDSVWRSHAEDLYAAMAAWADTVVLCESNLAGHGWSCAEEKRTCDFLGAFRLNRAPLALSLNAGAEGAWYWTELTMRDPDSAFARVEVAAEPGAARLRCVMVRNVAAAVLDLPAIDFPFATGRIDCRCAVRDAGESELGLAGLPVAPTLVTRDGEPYEGWNYDPAGRVLTLAVAGDAAYAVFFEPSGIPDAPAASDAGRLQVTWDAARQELLCRPGSEGVVHWRILDVAGRRAASGALAAGEGAPLRLALPARLPSGVYLATFEGSGATPERATCRVVGVRGIVR